MRVPINYLGNVPARTSYAGLAMTLLQILNLLGVAVFAISGALAAARKRLDLLGVVVVATVTGIGGGTVRDLLLNRHPIFWMREMDNLVAAFAGALVTLIYVRFKRPPERSLLIADALGLALFTIGGTQVAMAAALPAPIAVIMGVVTGVVGGVVRDILTAEIPVILRGGEFYATAAIVGATLYIILDAAGIPRPVPTALGMTSIALLRLGSILWGLQLPAFTSAE